MNHTQKLLQRVADGAHTGADGCDWLLERTEDEEMRRELAAERRQYAQFADRAERALTESGMRPKEKSPLARAGMWMGIQMNTMTDATSTHVADILIQGATMGVVSMTRDRRELDEADAQAQGLASDLITAQQSAIERLKAFL